MKMESMPSGIEDSGANERKVVYSGLDERGEGYNIVRDPGNPEDFMGADPFPQKSEEPRKESFKDKAWSLWAKFRMGHHWNPRKAEASKEQPKVSDSAVEVPKQAAAIGASELLATTEATKQTAIEPERQSTKLTSGSEPLTENERARRTHIKLEPKEAFKDEKDFYKKDRKSKSEKKGEAESKTGHETKPDEVEVDSKENETTVEKPSKSKLLERGTKALGGWLKEKTPEGMKNFLLAKDVENQIKETEVYQNREKAIEEGTQLTYEINQRASKIADLESIIGREDQALMDAVRQRKLRIELANGEADLIKDAEADYEAQEKIIDERRNQLVKERDEEALKMNSLKQKKEQVKANIRSDAKRIREAVTGRIEIIKEDGGYDEIVNELREKEAEIATQKEKSRKISASIDAYNATLLRGGVSSAKAKEYRAKIVQMSKGLKELNKTLVGMESTKTDIASKIAVMETRFGAVKRVLRKVGVISETEVDTSEINDSAPGKAALKTEAQATHVQGWNSNTVTASSGRGNEALVMSGSVDSSEQDEVITTPTEAIERDPHAADLESIRKEFARSIEEMSADSTRPKAKDVNRLIKIAERYFRIKNKPTKPIRQQISDISNIKDNAGKRDEKLSLLRAIANKLN